VKLIEVIGTGKCANSLLCHYFVNIVKRAGSNEMRAGKSKASAKRRISTT